MQIHQLSVADAIASLNSGPQGLSPAEALRRLSEYGPNRVEEVAGEPMLLRFLKEFTHFFALILWLAAALAFLAEWSDPGQGMAKVGYAILVVIVVSGLFSFWQEFRVERTLAALRELLPQQVDVLREGKAVRLISDQLVPGEIVLLEQGNNIPADCRLIEAFGVRINDATITGESLSKLRTAEPSNAAEVIHAENILLAGTSMVSGEAKAVVFATGMHTEFGKIAHLVQTGREAVSPLREQVAYLSRLIGILAVAIGLIFFAISRILGVPFWEGFIFAIGIIVAMVPEGLLPTLTLALVLATQRMAKRHVLIRYLPSVETLGSTTVICTDKTGTLTQNRMTVRQIWLGAGVECAPNPGLGPAAAALYRPFFMTARLCHDLREGDQQGRTARLGDPMEIALVETAERFLSALPACKKLDEIPFDVGRMRLSTVHETPEGPTLFCKGAPEMVLPLCDRILADGKTRPLDSGLRAKVHQTEEAMAAQGLRVIAMSYRPLGEQWQHAREEENLIFAGLAGLEDPPRPEVPEALRKCREAGIAVIMVTGDHPFTARAIGREIGLIRSDAPLVVTGEGLRALTDTQLRLALDTPEIIFARVGADQKRRIVEALKRKRRRRQRRAGAQERAHRNRDGDNRHRRGQGSGRHGAAGRQLRQHRQRSRGGTRRLQRHPQIPHLHSRPQRARADSVPGLLAVQRSAGAHSDSNPVDRHGNRLADRARPGCRETRPADDAASSPLAASAALRLALGAARLSVPGRDRSRDRDGGVLLRAARRRLAVRTGAGNERSAVPAGDHRLLQRDRRDADRERVFVPQRDALDFFDRDSR
jgi:magnesium-transporting ATPase (P-type)